MQAIAALAGDDGPHLTVCLDYMPGGGLFVASWCGSGTHVKNLADDSFVHVEV